MRTFIIATLILLFACLSFAGNIPLIWTASTSAGITGYKIYYGPTTGNYPNVRTIGNVTSYTLTGLPDGTYFIAATAFDASGNESSFSNEVSTTLKTINPPGDLKRVVPTTATLVIPVPNGKQANLALSYEDTKP